jgi:hypothetical protein
MTDRARVIAWADPGQENLLETAAREADVEIVGVGSPRPGGGASMSAVLGVPRVFDLRAAVRGEADLLWLTTSARMEADERRLARDSGVRTASTEPRPMSMDELLVDPAEATTADVVPLFRHCAGFRLAADACAEFGARACITVFSGGRREDGTLLARMHDAMDVVLALGGTVEGIDAALAGPLTTVPEFLGELQGHLTANLRCAEGSVASIVASDTAGGWRRQVGILGPGGCLRIGEADYEWIGPDGAAIETGGTEATLTPGALAGRAIARLLDGGDMTTAPADITSLLALCETARLSARTGQVERPRRLLEMFGL